MSLLTIYVPAYERPETLTRLLRSIDYQDEVRVIVSDDSPDRPVSDVCLDFPVEYTRNNYNLGRDGNVLKGLAYAPQSEFFWLMGDDDWLLPGALNEVLDTISSVDTDRLVLFSEAATRWVPDQIKGRTLTAGEVLDTLRFDASLLIATTLCTSGVFRSEMLDPYKALEKIDTYYGYAWASIAADPWTIADHPQIGVGTEPGPLINDALVHWQDYLDGLTTEFNLPPIPVDAARAWNFNAVEKAFLAAKARTP